MDKKTNVRIMGRAGIYITNAGEEHEGLACRYYTTIYNNKEDHSLIHKLGQLGCIIDSIINNRIYLTLPRGWMHIRVDKKTEFVMDDRGNERIRLDKEKRTSTLLRRYDFSVETVTAQHVNGDKKAAGMGTIIDNGIVIKSFPITHDELETVFPDVGDVSDEELSELLIKAMGIVMDNEYPNWRDELDYWDV